MTPDELLWALVALTIGGMLLAAGVIWWMERRG